MKFIRFYQTIRMDFSAKECYLTWNNDVIPVNVKYRYTFNITMHTARSVALINISNNIFNLESLKRSRSTAIFLCCRIHWMGGNTKITISNRQIIVSLSQINIKALKCRLSLCCPIYFIKKDTYDTHTVNFSLRVMFAFLRFTKN